MILVIAYRNNDETFKSCMSCFSIDIEICGFILEYFRYLFTFEIHIFTSDYDMNAFMHSMNVI